MPTTYFVRYWSILVDRSSPENFQFSKNMFLSASATNRAITVQVLRFVCKFCRFLRYLWSFSTFVSTHLPRDRLVFVEIDTGSKWRQLNADWSCEVSRSAIANFWTQSSIKWLEIYLKILFRCGVLSFRLLSRRWSAIFDTWTRTNRKPHWQNYKPLDPREQLWDLVLIEEVRRNGKSQSGNWFHTTILDWTSDNCNVCEWACVDQNKCNRCVPLSMLASENVFPSVS